MSTFPCLRRKSRSARITPPSRRGAALVECALTLPIIVLILLALLDLGMAATRYNGLAEVTRHIARETIRHGSLAPPTEGTWGPSPFYGSMASESDLVASARRKLLLTLADDVLISIMWLDGANSPGSRVQVEAVTVHKPLIPGLFVWGPLELRSSTTMSIVN